MVCYKMCALASDQGWLRHCSVLRIVYSVTILILCINCGYGVRNIKYGERKVQTDKKLTVPGVNSGMRLQLFANALIIANVYIHRLATKLPRVNIITL